jgi:hypothetical protein
LHPRLLANVQGSTDRTARTIAVSVICATRNRASSTLPRALQSIRDQSFRDVEVLVVDDGSDRTTHDEYERLWTELDDRFVLHPIRPSGSPGGGPSQARNHGISLARGEFVAFLDDDDWWAASDHLTVAVEALRRTGADYYFTNMQGIRDERVVMPDWYPDSPRLTAGRRVTANPPVYEVARHHFIDVMHHHFVHPDNSLVRRAVLLQAGGFFERVIYAEDYEMMMRIIDRTERILYRPDCVVRYRLPVADSISLTQSEEDQHLQVLFGTQHVRLKCQHPLVRRCARAREGWTLRLLARDLQRRSEPLAALSFAWQALCTYPTLGAVACFAESVRRLAARGSPGRVRSNPKTDTVSHSDLDPRQEVRRSDDFCTRPL